MTPQSLLSIAVRQVMLSPIKSEEPEAIKALSDLQRQILDLIPKHPAKITTPQVAELSGISVAHARITTEVQHFMTAVQQITGDAHRPATLDEAANLLAVTINNLHHRLESAETAVDSWLALAAEYECKSIPDLRVFITSSMSRIESMKQQIATLNEQLMTGEEEAVDVKEASFFAVFRPRRGLQRFKKLETAKVEAEVGARVDGQAELYAMVLVDVAKTGAVWEGKKAA